MHWVKGTLDNSLSCKAAAPWGRAGLSSPMVAAHLWRACARGPGASRSCCSSQPFGWEGGWGAGVRFPLLPGEGWSRLELGLSHAPRRLCLIKPSPGRLRQVVSPEGGPVELRAQGIKVTTSGPAWKPEVTVLGYFLEDLARLLEAKPQKRGGSPTTGSPQSF